MSARKKTSKAGSRRKTAPAGKKTAKKKASTAATKKSPTTAKKKPSAPAKKKASAPAKKKAGKGGVGVEAVTLGHLFALRPRVNTSFPQAEFLKAKRALAGEHYGSLEEAARALAERALADTNRKPAKHSIRRR